MLTLEQVSEMLGRNNFQVGDYCPEFVKMSVINYYAMSLHIDGILPKYVNANGMAVQKDYRNNSEYQKIFDQSLFSRHPREKEEQRWWRYSQYRPFQRTPFLSAISVITAAIFQDTGYALTCENEADENYLWGDEEVDKTSFFKQFQDQIKNIFTDGGGFLTVIPEKAWGLQKGKVAPRLKFIHSKDILYLSDDEIVFKEESIDGRNGVAWLINRVGYYRFIKNESGTKYVLADESGYYAHLFNRVPIVVAGGYKDAYGNISSWLSVGKPFADDFVSCKSAEQFVNKEASHPYFVAVAEDCPDCMGTGNFNVCSTCTNPIDSCECERKDGEFSRPLLSPCQSCGGVGRQSRNPGDWLKVPKDEMENDVIKIINPDVHINQHLMKTSDKVYLELERSLHVASIDGTNQSGISKDKSLESRYQFVLTICNDWFDRLIPTLINYTLALRNAKVVGEELRPYIPKYTLIKPTQFNIKTASDLLIEYQISVQAGMPQYVRMRQIEDYMDKTFGGDNVMVKMVRVINDLDMFSSDTNAEIMSVIGQGGASNEDWQYHKQLPLALRRVIRENGEEWFLKAPTEDIKEKSDKYINITKVPVVDVSVKEDVKEEVQPLYGQGNMATRAGKTPTGTGNYKGVKNYVKREENRK